MVNKAKGSTVQNLASVHFMIWLCNHHKKDQQLNQSNMMEVKQGSCYATSHGGWTQHL